MIGAPDQASRAWVYEQYDCLVQGNSAQIPGGDAGVVRIEGTHKALAMSADVTPRYCEADPFEGGKQAVAESWRNVTAVGGDPIALTDNLNFGNPEKPEAMGQFVRALQGIAEACLALNFPIVSGNVSLYNETHGEGILPSPTIVGVGLLPDVTKMATIAFKADGDEVVLIGGHGNHLGQSVYLRDLHGREEGTPPPVDLALEKKNGDFVRGLITSGRVATCHDLSDGGLGLALAEMAMAGKRGVRVELGSLVPHVAVFAEDQARYLIAVKPDAVAAILADAAKAGVSAERIGTVGGDAVDFGAAGKATVADLRVAFDGWFPAFMGGKA